MADRPGAERPGLTAAVAAWQTRKLLRAARAATLATQDAGQPFAGLVTPATDVGASLLLLLSDMSEHTKHLRRDGRCAVLMAGEAAEANPQTAPRVTVTGTAEIADDARLRARFLAVHPYAALYAGFGDFHLWRVRPEAAFYVGGFAQARRLRWAECASDPAGVAAIEAAAANIMAHCNQDHPDALTAIAGSPGDWRMVGVDTDGCDLAAGETVIRIAWSSPAVDGADVRRELVTLAQTAREAAAPAGP